MFGGGLKSLLDPGTALPIAAALMGGQGNQQNFSNALGMYGQVAQQNKTLNFLREQYPEIAAQVDAGLPLGEAFRMASEERRLKAQGPSYINAGDGNLFNPDTQEWVQAPGAGKNNEIEQRRAAAEQYGLGQDDPAYKTFILTGKMPREDAQPLTATDKKAMWAAEDELPIIDNTIASLTRAKELNTKTYTGLGAGTRGWLGTAMADVPVVGGLIDKGEANATSEFGSLMSMEAIQAMAQTLKGATTDQELNRFVSILADPSSPPEIRARTIDRMLTLADRVKQTKVQRVQSITGQGAPQGGALQAQPPGGQTSSGVQWSIEP